jgi:hypothetical protein
MRAAAWELDLKKFLTQMETQQLLAAFKIRTDVWLHVTIRDHFIINLGLSTRLRVIENGRTGMWRS